MVEVGTAIAAVKGTVDLTKRAIEIANKLGNVELKEIILDLKEDLLSKREAILQLTEKISELEVAASKKENLFFKNNVYWMNNEGTTEGPFCPGCRGREDKTVRMLDYDECWRCPACKDPVYK